MQSRRSDLRPFVFVNGNQEGSTLDVFGSWSRRRATGDLSRILTCLASVEIGDALLTTTLRHHHGSKLVK
jgi:hypothetical protein